LIFKAVRLARLHLAERAAYDLFVNRGEFFTRAGKKTRQPRKSVADTAGARRSQSQRFALTVQSVQTFGLRARATYRPELITEMLLDQRDLRLHSQFDVLQIGFSSAIRRDAGQDPSAAFLIHQAARAVYRIYNHAPHGVRFRRASRQNNPAARQPFTDQYQRRDSGDFAFEQFDQ
jgi:hypothetical protein